MKDRERERERERDDKEKSYTHQNRSRSLLVEVEEGVWRRSGGIRGGAGTVCFDFLTFFLCRIFVTNFAWARC